MVKSQWGFRWLLAAFLFLCNFAAFCPSADAQGYIRQPPGSNWCGPACLANGPQGLTKEERRELMCSYADRLAEQHGETELRGATLEELACVSGWDIVSGPSADSLRDYLTTGDPFIVLRRPKRTTGPGHFILVTRVSDDGRLYYYFDPITGPGTIDADYLTPTQILVPDAGNVRGPGKHRQSPGSAPGNEE